MIQAATTKAIEPKVAKAAVGKMSGGEASRDVEKAQGEADFANELDAAITEEAEPQVQAVEVSPEQLLDRPSSLINNLPVSGQPETTTPKVFDPALTQGVEELVQPKSAGIQLTDEAVLKLANGEVPVPEGAEGEVTFKMTPDQLAQVPKLAASGGRSPGLDFASTEIDPQLMNMEDFVAQKNLVAKKAAHPQAAYGMKAHPGMHKAALESGLKSTQVVKDAAAIEGQSQGSVNSQQFILNMMNEQGSPKAGEAQASPKVFDMNHVKSADAAKIMDQISDYIVQAKASKEPTVSMRVNHDELGMIDITVQKSLGTAGQDSIAISIAAHSADGKNFFQTNSKDLFSHMGQAGLNVSDLKVETSSQTSKNDFDLNQQGSRQGSQDKNFGSQENQRRHESGKRQDLWDLLKDKEAA